MHFTFFELCFSRKNSECCGIKRQDVDGGCGQLRARESVLPAHKLVRPGARGVVPITPA